MYKAYNTVSGGGDPPDKWEIARLNAMRNRYGLYYDDVLDQYPELDISLYDNISIAGEIFLSNMLENFAYEEAELDMYSEYM